MCECVVYDDGSMFICEACAGAYMDMEERMEKALNLVEKQAKDEALWFIAETAPEQHVQDALQELHDIISPPIDQMPW